MIKRILKIFGMSQKKNENYRFQFGSSENRMFILHFKDKSKMPIEKIKEIDGIYLFNEYKYCLVINIAEMFDFNAIIKEIEILIANQK